jgi:hypothetical protein
LIAVFIEIHSISPDRLTVFTLPVSLRIDGVAACSKFHLAMELSMTPLRKRLIEDMKVRNLAPATQATYIQIIDRIRRVFQASVIDVAVGILCGERWWGEAPSGQSLCLQVERIRTRRGFVLVASDAMHYYENIETMRAYASSAPRRPP